MKLAILGTRGVPANYGGFETMAEELGARLAARGHQVTVYGRRGFIDSSLDSYRGMRLVVLPSIATKHLETVSNTLLASAHAMLARYDAVLLCNAANAPFIPLLRWTGIPVAINVDGLERKRRKWGAAGRAWYRLGEGLSARLPNVLVTDARVIQRYYRRFYSRQSVMIPYGGDLQPPATTTTLDRLGLSPGEYVLYVSRFEPENNPDRVLEAWSRVDTPRRLVMVGGAPYAPDLVRRVHSLADERVLLPGPIYGEGYRELLFNSRIYIHATEVGGTHPALVEAMGAARPVLYYDTPENREVASGAGLGFRFSGSDRLERRLATLLESAAELTELGDASRRRVARRFRWSAVADAYEEVLQSLC
ncbi:MAG: glycosyltransferase [Thermoanaerobaculales bacterium]|nr:glycosyltransferase [Thermoanaerobaculales bacterium]